MWFKTLHLYQLHQEMPDAEAVEAAMAQFKSKAIGEHESKRVGWIAPGGRHDSSMLREINGHRLASMQLQERLLPSAAVKELLDERVAEQEADQGFPVTRSDRLEIKERLTEEMLPRAFVVSKRVDIWFSQCGGLIGINASSANRAEEALDLLRRSLGSLKVTPVSVAIPPSRCMTEWLNDPASRPEWLMIGENITLRGADDSDGVIRCRNVDVESSEVEAAIEAGRRVTELRLIIEGAMALTLDENLVFRSIRFADALIDEINDELSDEDLLAKMDAEFLMMAGVFQSNIEPLIQSLGGRTGEQQ